MSKKTLSLITALVLLTVVLVGLALQTSKQPVATNTPEVTTQPTVKPISKTTLLMEPRSVSLKGNSATLHIVLDSKDNAITAVQMEISYDPKVLSFVSITPSTLFSQGIPLVNTIDKKYGRISYALGLSPAQAKTAHTGSIEVATLTFNALSSASDSGSTEVTFLPKSLVSAKGINQSVLTESIGATILLK